MPFIQAYGNDSIFANEELRLDSFKNWPHESPVAVEALARAGLFYTGESVVYIKLLHCSSFKPHMQFVILNLYLSSLNNVYSPSFLQLPWIEWL